MSLNKIANPSANFVADSAKDLHSLVVGTFRLYRIIDRPMLAKADAGEIGQRSRARSQTVMICGKCRPRKPTTILGALTENIHSDFTHGLHGQRI